MGCGKSAPVEPAPPEETVPIKSRSDDKKARGYACSSRLTNIPATGSAAGEQGENPNVK